MPLNVCNKDGNHIGFIAKASPYRPDTIMPNWYLAAVTSQRVEDVNISMENIRLFVAGRMGAKNLLGRVNDDKLRAALEESLAQEYAETDFSYLEDYVRFKFLKLSSRDSADKVNTLLGIALDEEAVSGYVFLDLEKAEIRNGNIVLDDDLDYLSGERIPNCGLPIFAKITDYPYINTDIMGAGEGLLLGASLSDFGGRNHTHYTKLMLASGNTTELMELPILITAKKGMPIQLYMQGQGNRINRLFNGEAVYRF